MNFIKNLSIIILIAFPFASEFLYETESDIYGFQFRVTGVELISAYGGGAEEAGFQISYNPSTGVVVAFSLEGNTIPSGNGNLINIDYTKLVK